MSARVPPISFISWLRDKDVMIDEARDFIADARGDDTFPTGIRSMAALEVYLNQCSACDPAIDQARIAWRQYKATRRALVI